jgi:hypothetical protein
MKIHVKRKAYRLSCKLKARDSQINNAAGQWVARGTGVPQNSMSRDFSPQRG